VKGAEEAVVILAAATSYRSWNDAGGDPRTRNDEVLRAAGEKDYQALLDEHRRDYCSLYGRFSLDLQGEDSPAAGLPTPERIARYGEGDADPSLAVLHLNFARYLLICCSRPGGQPANLQGLWVEGLAPPWGSKYTININTEMNYWFAEPANLAECVEPLSVMVHEMAEAGKRTARTHYGAPGWVTHHNTDLWRAGGPIDGPNWGLWPMGGAWLCLHLMDRYAFDGDRDRLARDYPVLKGAAEFFLSSLVADPNTGKLVTCPSISPENTTPAGVAVCAGPSMDMSILRALFLAVEEASSVLGVDAEFRGRVAGARKRLAPLKTGKAGQLQEWQEDWDMEAPERTHRHISHLFALHPGSEISPTGTPELARAARKTLELRGDDGTGWSLAWKINFWARLGEGDRSRHLLAMLLTPQRTYPNLFDAHPPFQIDGNFGAANGIIEMLVQSHLRTAEGRRIIHLLPALPGAWSRGSVAGLRARGGFTVDMKWENGAVDSARLVGRPGSSLRLRAAGREKDYVLSAAGDLTVGKGGVPLP
jgi:alpha-L-fucosidase 2